MQVHCFIICCVGTIKGVHLLKHIISFTVGSTLSGLVPSSLVLQVVNKHCNNYKFGWFDVIVRFYEINSFLMIIISLVVFIFVDDICLIWRYKVVQCGAIMKHI